MKVTAIMGRQFCFFVSSRSGGEDRMVDWLNDPPSCTCPAWGMKQRAHHQNTGLPYLCAHLKAARNHSWLEIVEHSKEQLLSQ